MLPEAGAFEIVFLAAVALIVVGPKDLPVLLRRVGQFTAKMRGLAAEFRASFDEMARQSELDELRKEVDALRNGQFGSSATTQLNSHVDEINTQLNSSYWDASSQADPVQSFIDPHTGLMVGEGEETAALPPPGSHTPPLKTRTPRSAKKLATAARATAEPVDPAPKPRAAAKPPAARAKVAAEPAAKTPTKLAEADPPATPAAKPARKRAAKANPKAPANAAAEA